MVTLESKTFNGLDRQRLKSIQFNAWLAIHRLIEGTSKEKFYQGLGLE